MKKLLIVTCMLTYAFMISAQGGQGGFTPEEMAKRRAEQLERYKTELKLNDKQFADFKKIDDEGYTKQQALGAKFRDGGGDREKFMEEFTKLRNEQTEKVKKILTADQFKKYEEMLAAQRQRMGQGGGGNR